MLSLIFLVFNSALAFPFILLAFFLFVFSLILYRK